MIKPEAVAYLGCRAAYIVCYRRFGTTCRSCVTGSRCPLKRPLGQLWWSRYTVPKRRVKKNFAQYIVATVDKADTLPRNVGLKKSAAQDIMIIVGKRDMLFRNVGLNKYAARDPRRAKIWTSLRKLKYWSIWHWLQYYRLVLWS